MIVRDFRFTGDRRATPPAAAGPRMLVTMTSRRPQGLEFKAAPAMLAPRPATTTPAPTATKVNPARATVRMVAAVTSTVDEVGDRILPGAFARSIGSRPVLVCRGHDWNTAIGRVVERSRNSGPAIRRCPAPLGRAARGPARPGR